MEALCRLAVWGREWAKAKGPVAARSARRVAWVADRGGTVLEALFLATLDEARGPNGRGTAASEPVAMKVQTFIVQGDATDMTVGGLSRRLRWVLCIGERAERRRGV